MERVAEALPRAMEVVTLHLVADIPLARTAELVGVSERTAYRDLVEGRNALAQELKRSRA
jgi:DNA-directed RNA polymerase specialized sigma24 family protein